MHDRLPILTFERVAIDRSARLVMVDAETVQLARAEFDVLVALAERPRVTLSHRDVAQLAHVAPGSVTELVRRLRWHLPAGYIATVRLVGYRWDGRPVGGTPSH